MRSVTVIEIFIFQGEGVRLAGYFLEKSRVGRVEGERG